MHPKQYKDVQHMATAPESLLSLQMHPEDQSVQEGRETQVWMEDAVVRKKGIWPMLTLV